MVTGSKRPKTKNKKKIQGKVQAHVPRTIHNSQMFFNYKSIHNHHSNRMIQEGYLYYSGRWIDLGEKCETDGEVRAGGRQGWGCEGEGNNKTEMEWLDCTATKRETGEQIKGLEHARRKNCWIDTIREKTHSTWKTCYKDQDITSTANMLSTFPSSPSHLFRNRHHDRRHIKTKYKNIIKDRFLSKGMCEPKAQQSF